MSKPDETETRPVDLENWERTGNPVLELLKPETRVIPLASGSSVLGREKKTGSVVLDYPGISRQHAQLTNSSEGAMLMDLGSKNGTAVNGELIKVKRLHEGDRITMGSHVELRFSYAEPGPGRAVRLTPREHEVASLVSSGLTNKQIAQRLGVTRHAIDAALRTAFKRVNVKSRAALAAWLERNE